MNRIPVKSLSQEVARRIREMIRTGRLKQGERLVEKDLCQEMGISRTPLREACRLLNSEGLIDLVAHRGAYVARPSMKEIRDMFEVMAILEATCARLAAERMTDADFKKVEKLHKKLEKHFVEEDHEKYLEVNQRYHTLIQEMTGNKVFNDVINNLRQKILLYRYRQLYQPDRFEASMNEHRELLEAFRRRDPAVAEELMRKHLMNQCEALRRLYEGESEMTDKQVSNRGST